MKFNLTNVNCDDLGIIELNSLEDLIKLQKEKDHPIILCLSSEEGKEKYDLEIYDDYRE